MSKYHRFRTITKQFFLVPTSSIEKQYLLIMQAESELSGLEWFYPGCDEMRRVASQVLDLAGLNVTPRSYNSRYGKFRGKYTMESVGGHTNLVLGIVMRALRFYYGPNFTETDDGYTLSEIVEAVQRHDQPEVSTGDIPDNGARDEDAKGRHERAYHGYYRNLSPERDQDFEARVLGLLLEMNEQSSNTGRLLYVADKISANIITLYYDYVGIQLLMSPYNMTASKRDKIEMKLCDYAKGQMYYASEMWAIDYFKARRLVQYDETGYFTALMVMCTLLINDGKWYSWRECDYML